MNILLVACGGAIGASLRYCAGLIPAKGNALLITMVINILGSFFIGLIVCVASPIIKLSPKTTLFLKTGFCGGFTTFSTFSLETFTLFECGRYIAGSLYVLASLAFSL